MWSGWFSDMVWVWWGLGQLWVSSVGAIASVFLQSLLFGVSLADPLTLGGSTLILLTVAVGASLLPAWRAAKVDPLESLRAE